MQVSKTFKELHQIAFYLRLCELNSWVLQEAREIMLHIWCYHIHAGFFTSLAWGPESEE